MFDRTLTVRVPRIVLAVFAAATFFVSGLFVPSAQAAISSITITTPTAGVHWRGTQNITWNAVGAASEDTVDIVYTTDNFTNSLVAGQVVATVGIFAWDTSTLPDSSTYQIKIADHTTPLVNTVSSVFTIDNTAPVTTTEASIPPASTGWYNVITGKPTITLTCADALSGCGHTFYRWGDTESFTDGGIGPVIIPDTAVPEGDNTLYYYSEDNAVDNGNHHNVELTETLNVKVNTTTLTVDDDGPADFTTIQAAVNAAAVHPSITTVSVAAGTYAENVTITHPLNLFGAQISVDPGTRTPGGTNESTVRGLMTINADSVSVNGFTITNPTGTYGLEIAEHAPSHTGTTITYNLFDSISGTGQVKGVYLVHGPDDVTISHNRFSNISATGANSADAIFVGDSNTTDPSTGIIISNNAFNGITSVAKGAYGILVNNGATGAGGSTGVSITDNTFTNLSGGWTHAIGLEGPTPAAVVTGNTFSGLTALSIDKSAIFFEKNPVGPSVAINHNRFNGDTFYGVAVHPNDIVTYGYTALASINWWNDPNGPNDPSNPGGSGALVGLNVDYSPWCTNEACNPLDDIAPTAVLSGLPANPTNITTTDIAVGPADVVLYKYKFDMDLVYGAETPVAMHIQLSSLANGEHTLSVIGRDQAGNWQSEGSATSFTWTVDIEPPVLHEIAAVPALTTNNTPDYIFSSTNEGTITYNGDCTSVTTSAIVGDNTVIFGTLADGLHNTCTVMVTDTAGNPSTPLAVTAFTVDTHPPVLTDNPDMTVEATSASGALVTFDSPVATDEIDGELPVTCVPPSGSEFPLGTTTVTCSATDDAGHTGTSEFDITVKDTTAPVVAPHDNVSAIADQLGGAVVTYIAPNSTDAVDGDQLAFCVLPPDSVFPLGDTVVTCTKTDNAGNPAEPVTFTVTVVPATIAQLAVSADPTELDVSQSSTITINGQDQYGNVTTNQSGTVVLVDPDSDGAVTDPVVTLANGIATTTLTKATTGTSHVTVSSGILTPATASVVFTSSGPGDTMVPVVTSFTVSGITDSGAVLAVTTNENATCHYAPTDSGYEAMTDMEGTGTTAHVQTLTGLSPNTPYSYYVRCQDIPAGNTMSVSAHTAFTTLNTPTEPPTGHLITWEAKNNFAQADGKYLNGWHYVFKVTVYDTDETDMHVNFTDWVNTADATASVSINENVHLLINEAGGMVAGVGSESIIENGSGDIKSYALGNAYADQTLALTGVPTPIDISHIDLDGNLTNGRQIQFDVFTKIPVETPPGFYSTGYGIQTDTP